MAIVGTAFVRVKLISDKLTSDLNDAVTKSFDKANLDKIGEDAGARIGRSVAASMNEAVKDQTVTINADADTRGARDALDDVADADRTATIQADADTTTAHTKLSLLSRMRIVHIRPLLDNKATAAVEAALARLTGGRVLKSLGTSFLNLGKNMDVIAPIAGSIGAAFYGVVGAAGALVSNLAGIGYSLGQIAPLALVMPGMLTGMVAGFATLSAVLKDTKTVLKDLGPQFTKLQDSMSAKFWSVAEAPIRNMVETLMPTLNTELGNISTQFGTMARAITTTVGSALGLNLLTTILQDTGKAVDIAAEGSGWWTEALLRLGQVGSSYLPQLAGWLNIVGENFNNWLASSTESGAIFRWIDNAVVQAKALGTVLVQSVGILEAIGRAATAAGGATLTGFAEGLRSINAALSGQQGQQAMITFFSASHAAMAAMMPGLREFGAALRDSVIPSLTTILPTAGAALSSVFSLLGSILGSPAFTTGITNMMTGVASGFASLAAVGPQLGAIFGSIGTAFGVIATGLGQVIAAGINVFGPAIVQIGNAVSAVVPVLMGGLVGVLNTIGPAITAVVSGIASWVAQNPQMAATILAVAGGVAMFASAAVAVLTPLSVLKNGFTTLQSLFPGLLGGVSGLSGVLRGLGQIFIKAFPVAAIIGVLIGMYAASENFRNVVNQLGAALMGILGPAFAAIGMIMGSLGPLIGVVMQLFGDLAAVLLGPIVDAVSDLVPIFQFAFLAIGVVVSGAINIITGLIQGIIALFKGDFAGAGQAVSDAFTKVFAPLGSLITDGLSAAGSAITGWFSSVGQWFSSGWSTVTSGTSSALSGVGTSITTGLSTAGSAITGWFVSVGQWFADGWNAVVSGVSAAFTAIGTAISAGALAIVTFFQPVIDFFTSFGAGLFAIIAAPFTAVFEAIKATIAAAFLIIVGLFTGNTQLISDTFNAWIASLLAIVVNMGTAILGGFTAMWAAVVAFFGPAVAAVIGFFQNLWTSTVALWNSGVAAVVGFATALPGRVMAGINSLISSVSSWATTTWNNAKNAFSSGVAAVVSFASALPGRVMGAVNSLIGSLSSWASSTWNNVKSAFSAGVASVVATARALPGQVVSAVSSAGSALVSVGRNMMQGLLNGITAMAGAVASAARNVVSNAVAAAKNALGMASPSKVFRNIGQNVGLGFVIGLESMSKTVAKAGAAMVSAAIPSGGLAIPVTGIPQLGDGGIVSAAQGGTLALLAEARRSERVEPLDSQGLSARDRAIIKELSGGGGDNFLLEAGAITISARDMLEFNSLIDFLSSARVNMRKR